jgi:hypothetical protein
MTDIPRISIDEARREVAADRALLVCAYDDDAKCNTMRLAGAISLRELQARLSVVPKDMRLIFYCG